MGQPRGILLDVANTLFTTRYDSSVKYEEVYLADYESPRVAHGGLAAYFEFYNHQRPHQALDYRTPAEVYFASRLILDKPTDHTKHLKGG